MASQSSPSAGAAPPSNYEDALGELERLVAAMEGGSLPLDKLLETSDFITLHTTLTKESRHLIGKQALAKVKRGLRLVNAARGELVDEEALLAALEDGRVAGAALDVHAQEPPVDWRLVRHPRVVATPHVGAQTAEASLRKRHCGEDTPGV